MKIAGNSLEFWWNGAEYPVISENLSVQFDTIESTDSATPDAGKDHELGRASRSFQIEANLYNPDGAEIVTGTLTEGTRYRVTGGTITETQGTFTAGTIFESDGTGTASATNKVKPLGSKVTGKDMALTYDGADYPVTQIDYSEQYDELDATDSSTTGDAKETEVSRADRETKISAIVRDDEADMLSTSPVKKSAKLEFNSSCYAEGYVIGTQKNIVDNVNDIAKIDYSFKWQGKPTETALGFTAGEAKSFKLILKRGTVTNKEYVGTAVITQKSISSEISGLAKVNYTMSINGALTENVYAAD